VSLLTSARSGFLSGAILCWPLAAALARLSRPHVQGWSDLLLLGLYLLPIIAAAVAGLNLLGDILVRLLPAQRGTPGRAERLSARLGAAMAFAISLYLALVWGRSGLRLPGPPGLAAGLLIVVAAGLLIGWLVRGGALVVVASLGGRLEGAGKGGGSLLYLAVAAVVGAAAFSALVLARSRPPEPRPMPPIAAVRVPGRLIVIGVDGLEAMWLASRASRMDLPSLRAILDRGARCSLRLYESSVPPEVWTTLATGVTGDVHGVRSFEVYRLPGIRSPLLTGDGGMPARATLRSALRLLALVGPDSGGSLPLSSPLRRARAVWEVMAAAGSPAAVINWWATWPAQAEGAVAVSDRAFGALSALASGDKVDPARLEGLVHPQGLLKELIAAAAAWFEAIETRCAAALREGRGEGSAADASLRDAFRIDAYHLQVTDRILATRPVRSVFTYLPGQDIVLGRLLQPREVELALTGAAGGGLPAALRAVAAQEILLRELDRGLSVLLSRMGREDLLVLLADPGRFFRSENRKTARGLFVVFGDRVIRSGSVGEASEVDVAPTLQALGGLPRSTEQAGTVLPGLQEVVRGPLGQGSVPTFGDRPEALLAGGEGEEEVLDRLRSLGYIR